MYSNGKAIDKEDTTSKLNLKANSMIQLIGGESRVKIPSVVWYRAKNCELHDEVSAQTDSADALRFMAKVDCMFCGLVWTKNHCGKDFQLKVEYRLNNGDDEEHGDTSE